MTFVCSEDVRKRFKKFNVCITSLAYFIRISQEHLRVIMGTYSTPASSCTKDDHLGVEMHNCITKSVL